MTLQWGRINEVLCLGAHADDIEIGCGGTLLSLLQQKPRIRVHWVVFSGDRRRQAEAARSAERFLASAAERQVQFQQFRDSYFPFEGAAVKDCFHELGRRVRPDVVFTHRRDDRHQDHRLLAELTWNTFRSETILEYEIPKYEGDLGRPNLFVPLEEAVCRSKVETLLECFESQHDKPWFTADTFWALLRLRGLESRTRHAEAFYADKLIL